MIVSKTKFAKLAGVSLAYIAEYIKRHKIIPSGKMIDTSIDMNAYFIQKRKRNMKKPPQIDLQFIDKLIDNEPPENFKEFDKEIALLMVKNIKKGTPCPIAPADVAITLFTGHLIEIYENAASREISILRKLNKKPDIETITNEYKELAIKEITAFKTSLLSFIEEIIEDHSPIKN